jgi:uncharacterized damage-inducible protein DinB
MERNSGAAGEEEGRREGARRAPEYWLSGPVEGVPVLLQPVAHALLQSRREVEALIADFPPDLYWMRPAGLASVGFHLQHLSGVLDRLFTYARGEALSDAQLAALRAEGQPGETPEELTARFRARVDTAIAQLRQTDPETLTEPRGVGRARIPSTVMGLLVHAAEHTMRHTGQLLVTVRFVSTTFA